MSNYLKIALAQTNFTVGDIDGNCQRIISQMVEARDELACELIIFPELAITGYPPEDLLLRPDFINQTQAALKQIIKASIGIAVIVGYPRRDNKHLLNMASFFYNGECLGEYAKQYLPNYNVFDEKRYFKAGHSACVVNYMGVNIGLTICEDIWRTQPARQAKQAGAELLININASPYHKNRIQERQKVVSKRARDNHLPIIYSNLVGGQDELVFDGASFVVNSTGQLCQQLNEFEETLSIFEFDKSKKEPVKAHMPKIVDEYASVYRALIVGVRDYINKNNFSGAVLGLSGGIDSALTLAIAVDALGANRVKSVLMPSRYTSQMSLDDAWEQVRTLGVTAHEISIETMFSSFTEALAPVFKGLPPDITEENIQARCRGVLLMAISNKTGNMVLTTGNKSEMAVGYATLYGDMAGGYAAIKDVPKTLVYKLANYRNSIAPVIPQRVIDRPPSAELAPNQTDQDSLPDYEILDPILEAYVEQDFTPEQIIAMGFDDQVVYDVLRRVDNNEYKRRQSAPGVKITPRAFGRDRRYPLTSGFKNKGI